MPAISGRKIRRQFRIEKKNAGNVGSAQNVGKFGPEKKCRCFQAGKKIAGKPAIAGELTGLNGT